MGSSQGKGGALEELGVSPQKSKEASMIGAVQESPGMNEEVRTERRRGWHFVGSSASFRKNTGTDGEFGGATEGLKLHCVAR